MNIGQQVDIVKVVDELKQVVELELGPPAVVEDEATPTTRLPERVSVDLERARP